MTEEATRGGCPDRKKGLTADAEAQPPEKCLGRELVRKAMEEENVPC